MGKRAPSYKSKVIGQTDVFKAWQRELTFIRGKHISVQRKVLMDVLIDARPPVDTGELFRSAYLNDTAQGSLLRGFRKYGYGGSGGGLAVKPIVATARTSQAAQPKRYKFYIGYLAPYAAEVHEDLNVYHKNGEAKFLERAMNRVYLRSLIRQLRQAHVRNRLMGDGGGVSLAGGDRPTMTPKIKTLLQQKTIPGTMIGGALARRNLLERWSNLEHDRVIHNRRVPRHSREFLPPSPDGNMLNRTKPLGGVIPR